MEIATFDDPAEQLRPFTGGFGGTLAIEGLSLFRNTGRRSAAISASSAVLSLSSTSAF
jgi:hypothetical protein